MNKLIIFAHPKEQSFNRSILNSVSDGVIAGWHALQVIDLYKEQEPFLTLENRWRYTQFSKFQEQISWADELIFIFPIRWFDCPAIMKNFIDNNLNRWFGYDFEAGRRIWLLKWKTARLICTCGGWRHLYYLPYQIAWGEARIRYCGMKYRWATICGSVFKIRDTARHRFLDKVYNIWAR